MKSTPKAIVQRTIDRKYLAGSGDWVTSIEGARVFSSVGPAKVAAKHQSHAWRRDRGLAEGDRGRTFHYNIIPMQMTPLLDGVQEYTP